MTAAMCTGTRGPRNTPRPAPRSSSTAIAARVLQSSNPDALRHPASLTKVMTLYLLFERLDSGKMKLDTPLKVSEHAADQSPTKLDLKPGSTITVEDAIKGVVTRSANDAAVAIAENIGGDEDGFAKMMTQKAHALGMTRTTYVNASGLPDDDQITTARDQALLGRAIQDRFPRYYKYFSTESFVYHGEAIRSHNHLLGKVEGVDGIKTGFTRASGFNLLTSVHRDGRFIVAVVMGGHSAFERDAHMRDLISEHLKEAALRRTVPHDRRFRRDAGPAGRLRQSSDGIGPDSIGPDSIGPNSIGADGGACRSGSYRDGSGGAERAHRRRDCDSGHQRYAPGSGLQRSDPAASGAHRHFPHRAGADGLDGADAGAGGRGAPGPNRSSSCGTCRRPGRGCGAAAGSGPAGRPASGPAAGSRPASSSRRAAAHRRRFRRSGRRSAHPSGARARPGQGRPGTVDGADRACCPAGADRTAGSRHRELCPASSAGFIAARRRNPRHDTLHGGWLIQIGAFDDEDQAKQHLSAAQGKVHTALAAADPFTERVQKGDKALFRARFAGFDKATAETACKELKRSDFQCMALKD